MSAPAPELRTSNANLLPAENLKAFMPPSLSTELKPAAATIKPLSDKIMLKDLILNNKNGCAIDASWKTDEMCVWFQSALAAEREAIRQFHHSTIQNVEARHTRLVVSFQNAIEKPGGSSGSSSLVAAVVCSAQPGVKPGVSFLLPPDSASQKDVTIAVLDADVGVSPTESSKRSFKKMVSQKTRSMEDVYHHLPPDHHSATTGEVDNVIQNLCLSSDDFPSEGSDYSGSLSPVGRHKSQLAASPTMLSHYVSEEQWENVKKSFADLRGKTVHETLQKIIVSAWFEFLFGLFIIANCVMMALRRQYEGLESAYVLNYRGAMQPAEAAMPGMRDTFAVTEICFGILFLVEVVFKMCILRRRFFRSGWNLFDFFVVLLWVFDQWNLGFKMNPLILRLGRLAKLFRLLRVVRWVTIFDPLHLIIKAVRSSVSVLMWSIVVLVLLIAAASLFTSQMVESYIRDVTKPDAIRIEVFEAWGTFTRAMVSMFEVSLGNWAPPCHLLQNEVNELWALFFLIYKCTIGFAVVQVITAVFIQQTFKVAARDEEVMINERKSSAKAMLKNLGHLFEALDISGDGLLTPDEFAAVLQDKRVKTWFSAIEIDAEDVQGLFELLDDGDGYVTRDEFIKGIKAIKGTAKSSDMVVLLDKTHKLRESVIVLDEKLQHMQKLIFPDIDWSKCETVMKPVTPK